MTDNIDAASRLALALLELQAACTGLGIKATCLDFPNGFQRNKATEALELMLPNEALNITADENGNITFNGLRFGIAWG